MQVMDATSWVEHRTGVMKPTTVEMEELFEAMPAREDRPTFFSFGRHVQIPRTQQLFGDVQYGFSRLRMTPNPKLPSLVARCFAFANETYPAFQFNCALVDLYEDGNDYVRTCADNNRCLIFSAPILSFSFGATRAFHVVANVKHTNARIRDLRLQLQNDDLVVMGGDLQAGFKHCVPKMMEPVGRKFNITIRSVKKTTSTPKKMKVGVE